MKAGLQIPETLLVQVIINGLQPPLKGLVIPHDPQSLETLSLQVRLAEAALQATQDATPSISSGTYPGVDNDQLATIAALLTTQQQQLDKLTAQMAHDLLRQNVNTYVNRDQSHQPGVNTRRSAQPLQQQQRQQQQRQQQQQQQQRNNNRQTSGTP
ncbi:putative mediator of RNA polymerase II transcription subunit 15 [Haliotis rubra]|uniref:putative mediator of RNA polymerase II transcription subunit 15 n=1 Tax=Haliotis rubra TaxID=36100 RepID=UPI001EE616F2|nr:putative mediator of RNA polymerase II transcription subunit 15 [Haliotis rubra]